MGETLAETGDAEFTDDNTEADVTDDAAAVEPDDGTVEPEAEAEAPGFDWDAIRESPEAQEWVGEAAQQQVVQFFEQLAAQQEPQYPDLPEVDPFSDDFAQQLAAREEALLSRQAAMFEQRIAPLQEQHVNTTVDQIVSETAAQFKDAGVTAEDIGMIAGAFAPQLHPGASWSEREQAARAAAQQGAEYLAARDKRISAEALKQYRTGMGEVAETPAEPGVNGAAVDYGKAPSTYEEATRRVFDRHGIRY